MSWLSGDSAPHGMAEGAFFFQLFVPHGWSYPKHQPQHPPYEGNVRNSKVSFLHGPPSDSKKGIPPTNTHRTCPFPKTKRCLSTTPPCVSLSVLARVQPVCKKQVE